MFAINEHASEITSVSLTPLANPDPFHLPVNAYIIRTDAGVALVNPGPVSAWPQLRTALEALQLEPRDVERVVATGHRPSLVGNAAQFHWADLFVLAPEPFPEAWSLSQSALEIRRHLLEGAKALSPHFPMDLDAIEQQLDTVLTLEHLPPRVVPLHTRHPINLAGISFQVIATPGAGPGAAALFNNERGWLFAGDALPHDDTQAAWIVDAQALLQSLEQIRELPSRRLFPNHGQVASRPDWAIRRTSLFITNFLSNLPLTFKHPTHAAELVQRDLALGPETPLAFIAATLGYHALCEELLRTDVIDASGEGLMKTYGETMEPRR